MITIEELAQVDFFKDVPPTLLAAVLPHSRRVTFPKDAVIFEENQKAEKIYFLLEGQVAIMLEVAQGRKMIVYTISPNQSFGWSALISPYILTAGARCIVPSVAFEIDGEALRTICRENKEIGYSVMHQLSYVISTRLRSTTLQLINMLEWEGMPT